MCPTHPPPAPQGPCLMPLPLKQKADFVHKDLQGLGYYPPSPRHTSSLHYMPECTPASGLAEVHLFRSWVFFLS